MKGISSTPKVLTDDMIDTARRMRQTAIREGYRYVAISFTTKLPRFSRTLKQARHRESAVYDYESKRWFGVTKTPWTPHAWEIGGSDA